MKRSLDVVFSSILTLILSPFFIIVVVIVLVTMGRPVLFSQVRPGLHGKPFRIYKFRTMKNGFDADGKLLDDSARLTTAGKFLRKWSLDEIPQLFNIIRGDISFVGPRPLLMDYLPRYTAEQARRHDVKPGITGWAQVNGRNAISWEDKFELDVWYVENRSFILDLKILWSTVLRVLKREGITANDCATMPEFMGSGTNSEK